MKPTSRRPLESISVSAFRFGYGNGRFYASDGSFRIRHGKWIRKLPFRLRIWSIPYPFPKADTKATSPARPWSIPYPFSKADTATDGIGLALPAQDCFRPHHAPISSRERGYPCAQKGQGAAATPPPCCAQVKWAKKKASPAPWRREPQGFGEGQASWIQAGRKLDANWIQAGRKPTQAGYKPDTSWTQAGYKPGARPNRDARLLQGGADRPGETRLRARADRGAQMGGEALHHVFVLAQTAREDVRGTGNLPR